MTAQYSGHDKKSEEVERMRRIKKFLALGLAGALTVSALAGCGGKETGADAGSSAESGENTGGG